MDSQRNELLELNTKREKIEQQMADLVDVLNSMNGAPGLQGALVDNEGFPRADVDLVEARKLRHQHACLQTDHGRLMKEIETKLFGHSSHFGLQAVYK